MTEPFPDRNSEQGQTIVLVAISLAAFLAMAMLAIDVVTLYNARSEAQRVADASALAGARAFVNSGFTSSQLGDPLSSISVVCTPVGGAGLATQAAAATASQNQIAGNPASASTVNCNFPNNGENPQITVTVQSAPLPTLFSRIFSRNAVTATATSTAEAFNASGTTTPISVTNVKPWAIPNCAPGTAPTPTTPCPPYFFDTTAYNLLNPSAYVGQTYPFYLNDGNAKTDGFWYFELVPPFPTMCPPDSQVGCNGVNEGDNFMQNIACTNVSTPMTCGEPIGAGQVITANDNADDSSVAVGTQCLIHASGNGLGLGQDVVSPTPPGAPVNIAGGSANLNPNLQNKASISRSDSVVTIPVYDGTVVLCNTFTHTCPQFARVIGFLQLAIEDANQYTDQGGIGSHNGFDAVIVNAVGCNPNPSNPVVTGGTISPIPVRLISQ